MKPKNTLAKTKSLSWINERFATRINTDGHCWHWTGGTNSTGYGKIWNGRRYIGAHRFAYELMVGNINKDLELDHLCKNTLCVNPNHLEEVTHNENVNRGDSPRGYSHRTGLCKRGHKREGDNLYKNGACKLCVSKLREQYKFKRS